MMNATVTYKICHGILELGEENKLVHKSWTEFRFPLVAGFVSSAEVKPEYDGEPVAGKDKLDTICNFKIDYAW